MSDEEKPFDGGCTCHAVRYRLRTKPMIVNCCHCRWCQRETGTAFALNAMIEVDRVELLQGQVEVVDTPSNSGKGQKISRCPACHIALWSNCAGAGDAVRFVRVGTLDEPDRLPPDVHIFTASKQPWVLLPPGTPAVALQFVRKLSGFNSPSRANQVAFDQAVEAVAATARTLVASLVTNADPRNREEEGARARARSAERFGGAH